MEPELPGEWTETDRIEEFASDIGVDGPVTNASAVYESESGHIVVVHDELDKPIEARSDPRFIIEVIAPDSRMLVHGHTETSHERAEAAVSAITYMVTHLG